MTEMPTVSIVLPSYNGGKYIMESVDSILGQTYTDWELIIVDDCSTDNTLEIARRYEAGDKRIRVIHNEVNQKLPGALNAGFQYAKGKYLTWTSDDNRYLADALAVMVERLEASGAAMVCGGMHAIDDSGRLKWDKVLLYQDGELCRWNSVGACFLYRREVWDHIGEYDTELYCVEDYDYWLRIKQEFGKIEPIDRVLYQYRYHENSLTATKREIIRRALIRLRKKHIDFLMKEFEVKYELLSVFYYEMEEKRTMDGAIRERIRSDWPELRNDTIGKRGKYIVFGAGEYGKRAAETLGEAAVFFADNSPEKAGKYVYGKRVLSFQEMIQVKEQYDIMIAVHWGKVSQLVRQLTDYEVKAYCTWQTYLWELQAESAGGKQNIIDDAGRSSGRGGK